MDEFHPLEDGVNVDISHTKGGTTCDKKFMPSYPR
jgi:hypothetical protein